MNNRENLLKCALEMFAARGYDAVGVQEIVDAAGIKKPTLYHYFGSKSGLLKTLITEPFTPFIETLESGAAYKGDVTTSLRTVAQLYFNFAQQNPRLYRFYLAMWFAPAESDPFAVMLSLGSRQQQIIEALFLDAARDHGNMKGRQHAYAASFMGIINTYVMLSLNGFAEFDDNLVYTTVHQFMHGIFS